MNKKVKIIGAIALIAVIVLGALYVTMSSSNRMNEVEVEIFMDDATRLVGQDLEGDLRTDWFEKKYGEVNLTKAQAAMYNRALEFVELGREYQETPAMFPGDIVRILDEMIRISAELQNDLKLIESGK